MVHLRRAKELVSLSMIAASLSAGCTSGSASSTVHDAGSPPHEGGSTKPKADAANVEAGAVADAAKFPGNTGAAVTAGGTVSKSTHYQFTGTLGQTPTGNGVSGTGRLNGGVVAATQQQP